MTRRILLWAWVMLCLLGAPPFYFVYGQDAVTDTTLSISADVESPGPKAIKTSIEAEELSESLQNLGPSSTHFTWLFIKTLGVMVFVIGLAIFLLRFIIPKLSLQRNSRGGADFQVLGRYALDTKKGLYVVQVEGRRFLLGSTEHSLVLITELKSDTES